MKRIPRYLAITLILALVNMSYINLALAGVARTPKFPVASPQPSTATEPPSPTPENSHATKADILQDLDDTKNDLNNFLGDKPNGFGRKLLADAGLDPFADIDDAKTVVGNLGDSDFSNGQFDQLHNKLQKRKHHMVAILNNKSLMALIHNPSPVKYHVVMTSAANNTSSSNLKALIAATRAKDLDRSFQAQKKSALRGSFGKDLMGLNVTVVPEYDSTCDPGSGIPGGMGDLMIAKGVSLGTEIAKEGIPDDTAAVIPHGIAVVAWGVAKSAELVLEALHSIYLECKNQQQGDEFAKDFADLSTNLTSFSTEFSSFKDTFNSDNQQILDDFQTTWNKIGDANTDIVNNINSKGDSVVTSLSTKIDNSANKTGDAITSSTTTITTNLGDTAKTIINNDNSNTTNINNKIDSSKTTIINNDNTNAASIITTNNTNTASIVANNNTNTANIITNNNSNATSIINNANSNTTTLSTLSLRLMIESDLQQPDNATPLAIFETPAAKGGYLELVRSIIVETYQHLTSLSAAQINAALAAGDSYKAAGNYKAAYAAYKKAYKTAAN